MDQSDSWTYTPQPRPAAPAPQRAPLSPEARHAVLQDAIRDRVRRGYRVLAQTDTTAQVVKPKRFSIVAFLFWSIISLGLGLILYPAWYLAKRDRQHYLSVDEYGQLEVTSQR